MYDFVAGMITVGFLIAAVFFFRFWKRTSDWLFAIFGVAFVLFAINQAATTSSLLLRDDQSWIYLFRLAGFVLLIVAIVVKNISPRTLR